VKASSALNPMAAFFQPFHIGLPLSTPKSRREFGIRDLRRPDRWGPALKLARPNARHRLQAREAERAIGGLVRRIIDLMFVIVTPPVI
jgi:hypothetical protein